MATVLAMRISTGMSTTETLAAHIAPIAGGRATARLDDGRARIILDVTGLHPDSRAALEQQLRDAALTVPGVADVQIVLTSERVKRRIIAVASGKGGVGKSTVSANLAIALHRLGFRVGLVDADIHGPSQPRLMGVEGRRPTAREKVLVPVDTAYGVPLLSMGQLVAAEQAIAWRGPMMAGALAQLVDADWGATELLVLDLPPGTGDVQLSMIQKHRPVGAVIVSTPQDLALIDARRAIDLFQKADIPLIGLIENMAGYRCPHCGEVSDPFGHGGARDAAAALDIPFLGAIPLDIAIRTASDAGTPPITLEGAAGGAGPLAFGAVAAQVAAWLGGPK